MREFLEKYASEFTCKEWEDGFLLLTPITYQGADHTFSFFIKRTETGGFIIDDRGKTLDFARENFNPKRYTEKIDAICERFEIERRGERFVSALASYESNQTMRNLHSFFGAMEMIVNVDLF